MSETAQALGQKLKAEREKRGMSAQKMADDMHLDAWVIDALEAGDYERIGPSVYAQGHLRKYASILGVLGAQAVPAPQSKPTGPVVPTPIIRLDPPGRGGGVLWPAVGGFAVIALVAGGIVWWRPWHAAPAAAARAAVARARAPVAASVPAPESTPSPGSVPAGYTADAGVAAEAASTGPVPASRATAAAAPAASAAELTPGVGRARLRLSFSADSRVAVYDYTGKSVYTGNGRANSVKTLSGMAPFRVYLGFASGVQLQVNDRAVAIGPQFVSGDVARFEAGADGVLRRDPHPPHAGAPASPRG
jgi:cytoskeleton protein RodZ